jgi:hypothetical protein
VTSQDQQVTAGAIVEDGAWLGRLQGELRGLLASVFAQAALKALQQFIVADLGDVEAVVVLDETAELKKGA